MDEQNGIYIPDAVCDAVRIVRGYVNCDCTSEDCAFDLLVRAVSAQKEEQRKIREQAEADRQEKIEIQKINSME